MSLTNADGLDNNEPTKAGAERIELDPADIIACSKPLKLSQRGKHP